MKKYFVLSVITLVSSFGVRGQLIINPQLPPGGIVQRDQLWNIIVTNASRSTVSAPVTMTMMNIQTGDEIMAATTAPIIFAMGNNVLNAAQLMPIQYNVQSGYTHPDPNGYLPPGNYLICYSINIASETKSEKCIEINIEPLSPPQLIMPEDQSTIDSTVLPQFSWLPPAPAIIFNDLRYDLYIVPVNEGQTATDAIQLNIPILFQPDLSGAAMVYPMAAPALETGVKYAWRVTAKNNGTPVSNSDTWVFTLGSLLQPKIEYSEMPYVRLKKNGASGYAICSGKLKFAYINETADTSWNVTMYDINRPDKREVPFSLDSVSLKRGLNLVEYDLGKNSFFMDRHIYLLELRNTRNETWRMKFEYLKPRN